MFFVEIKKKYKGIVKQAGVRLCQLNEAYDYLNHPSDAGYGKSADEPAGIPGNQLFLPYL